MNSIRTADDLRTQYDQHKATRPGSLLGFRVGDFVEWFFEDAITVANTLGIVLTKRGKCRGEPVPMAGVPLMRVPHYVQRLEAAGFSVTIEDPRAGAIGQTIHEDDAEPVDIETLPPATQGQILKGVAEYEKQKLRAAALYERLAARGLAPEADVLGVLSLTGNINDEPARLDALESIVGIIERSPLPNILDALSSSSGTQAGLRLLARIHAPDSTAAYGERFAVATICKSDTEGSAFEISGDAGVALRATIEEARASLANRLEMIEEALRRLDDANIGQKGPLQ